VNDRIKWQQATGSQRPQFHKFKNKKETGEKEKKKIVQWSTSLAACHAVTLSNYLSTAIAVAAAAAAV